MEETRKDNLNIEKTSFKSALIKQFYLIKAELLSLRLEWKWALIIVLATPLSMLFLMSFFFKDNREYLVYAITGNLVMSLVTGTMLTLGQELGILKDIRGFDYYAALPVRKINLIIAYLLRATLTTLPSMLVIIIVSRFFLHIDVKLHISLLIVAVLSGLSLSAVGAFIGIYSKNASQASILTQVLQPLVVYFAPVFIPMESLPPVLRYIAYIIPTKYVAEALRAGTAGYFDWRAIGILFLFSVISIFLIEYRMDWRQK